MEVPALEDAEGVDQDAREGVAGLLVELGVGLGQFPEEGEEDGVDLGERVAEDGLHGRREIVEVDSVLELPAAEEQGLVKAEGVDGVEALGFEGLHDPPLFGRDLTQGFPD